MFLGFSWKFRNGVTPYFVFTVLSFGLSSAPHIFTKVFKRLEKYWRVFGFIIALFLDDGFLLDYTESTCNFIIIITAHHACVAHRAATKSFQPCLSLASFSMVLQL